MECLNKVELRGFVGNVRSDVIGDTILTRFSVATNHLCVGADGESMIETTWHACKSFDKEAAKIEKGDKVHLSGRIQNQRYVDSDGNNKSSFEILVNNLEIDN